MKFLGLIILWPLTLMAQHEYDYWSAADLDAHADSLSKNLGANNSAVADRIIDYGNYFAAMVHREPGSNMPELHDDWADVYVVSDGEGVLIVGGTIVEPRETAPGEIRGAVIEGGVEQRLAEGDIVHIPAGTPHNVLVEPGRTLTYYIFKVKRAE